jgi:hypothetical protein
MRLANRNRDNTGEIVAALEKAVNSFSFNPSRFYEEIKGVSGAEMMLEALAESFVNLWADAEDYRSDGRNEICTRLCKEIQPLLDKDREDLFPLLNEHIFRTHKTLVQSMGNLFFDVLKDKNFEIRHYMNEKYGEKSRMPMI